MRSILAKLVLSLGWVLACPIVALAQTQAGITGKVNDATGGIVPGTRVTVTNVGTNAARTALANDAGVYSFPSLTPGIYSVRAEAKSFQTVERTGIELQVQQLLRLDFQMQVGQVTEVVTVSGGAPLLTTENATVGAVIENRRIVDLPLNGRDFLQLVALSPNVSIGFGSNGTAAGRQGGQRSAENISVAGQRSEYNYFSLDGINNTDVSYNIYVFLPSIDALQEFKVQSGVFPAEFGRATSQINVSTKPGTNRYHGALFEFLRNSKLDAETYAFTSARPAKAPYKRNQYGFTLGGPVLIPRLFNGKNKLFFMANYEAVRDRLDARSIASVPSPAMRAGDFSGVANIYDPSTRVRQPDGSILAQPFPSNIVPASRMDGRSLKLLEFYPAPNIAGAGLSRNYQNTEGQRTDTDQFTARVDFIEGSKSTWIGRYSWGSELQLKPTTFPQQGAKLETFPKQVMLSNIRVLSPTAVNEFRFGYNQFINANVNYNAFIRNVVAEIGGLAGVASPFPDIYGIPGVSIAGFSGFGEGSPFIDRNKTFQWMDSVSLTRGKHGMRFGAEIRRDRFNELGNSFVRGNFIFSGQSTNNPVSSNNTGAGFADYLLGLMRESDAALLLANTQLRATSQSYYFDDTWRVFPTLTISVGLRYENLPPYYDKHDSVVNPLVTATADPSQHPTLIRAGTGEFYDGVPFRFDPAIKVTRSNSLMGRRLVASDNNNFAPRIGIAYSPNTRWTLRTGFGVFYTLDGGDTYFELGRNLAGRRADLTDSNFPDLNFNLPYHNLSTAVPLLTTPFVLAETYTTRVPYVMQYLFNVQRQVSANLAVEVGYIGNEGRKLQRIRTLNDPPPGPGAVVPRRPWPELGQIQQVEGSVNSVYNALALKVQQRFSAGLSFVAAYTWSRTIDNGSAIRNHGGDTQNPQNSYDLRNERGLANFHLAHRSVNSIVWELPFGKGRRWLTTGALPNAFWGGWQLSSIATIQTGFPVNVVSGIDTANTGAVSNQRPDATGVSPALPNGQRGPQRWFNTAAFKLPAPFTFGNVGRNTMIGPGLFNWDFSMLKEFPIMENHRLQFRFEAFNFPNHPNFGLPDTTLVSSSFGSISGTATRMRQIQFALKYVF